MVIEMAHFGRALATRANGRASFDAIMAQTSNLSTDVTFDFSNVDSITNSFADEVFGRMASEWGMDFLRSHISFRNINRFWAQIIRTAMDARSSSSNVA